MDYERWRVEHLFLLVPAQQYVGRFLATFNEFPPSQKPGSFSIDQAMAALQQTSQTNEGHACTSRERARWPERDRQRILGLAALPCARVRGDGRCASAPGGRVPPKRSIVEFVSKVTKEGGAGLRAAAPS